MPHGNKDELIAYPKLVQILDIATSCLKGVPVTERKSNSVSSGWRTLEDIIYDIEEIRDELKYCVTTYRDLAKIYKKVFCTMERGAAWVNADEHMEYYQSIESLDKAYNATCPYAVGLCANNLPDLFFHGVVPFSMKIMRF